MNHAFQSCSSSHSEASPEFNVIYDIHGSQKAAIATVPAEKQQDYLEVLSDFIALGLHCPPAKDKTSGRLL